MSRVLIGFEYCGTKFAGSQRQPQSRTVCGVLETALNEFVAKGETYAMVAASRTDAGVHAMRNCAHVDFERAYDCTGIVRGLNARLRRDGHTDVRVLDARTVDKNTHARFDATHREYVYRIVAPAYEHPVFAQDQWHAHRHALTLERMQEAAQVYVGRHDFSAFRVSRCQARSPVREIEECRVTAHAGPASLSQVVGRVHEPEEVYKGEENGTCGPLEYRVYVRAQSFLMHQVRKMVAGILLVGQGSMDTAELRDILESGQRERLKSMAPAKGLYLLDVGYPRDLAQDEHQGCGFERRGARESDMGDSKPVL